jgi:hypothetical protein
VDEVLAGVGDVLSRGRGIGDELQRLEDLEVAGRAAAQRRLGGSSDGG